MRKFIIPVIILGLFTAGSYNLDAKGIKSAPIIYGPVKNIPPPVLQALAAAISTFDTHFDPTYSTSTVTWSRIENVFHVTVIRHCSGTDTSPIQGYTYIANIEANGDIIYHWKGDLECGHLGG